MIYVQIVDGNVVDAIVADAEFVALPHVAAMGEWRDVTNMKPRPGPGWTFKGGKFSRPAAGA